MTPDPSALTVVTYYPRVTQRVVRGNARRIASELSAHFVDERVYLPREV